MAKIINHTTVEKVLSLGATQSAKTKRSKSMVGILILCVSGGMCCIVFLPWKHALTALLFAAIITIVCFAVYIKATDSTPSDPDKASVIRTGESFDYNYEFSDEGFTVSGFVEKTVRWDEVASVRNIGVAYQIKCGEDHFTVKKQGFEGGNDKAFKALLESKEIKVN